MSQSGKQLGKKTEQMNARAHRPLHIIAIRKQRYKEHEYYRLEQTSIRKLIDRMYVTVPFISF